MESSHNETQESKISVEETTQHNVTMPPAIEQHIAGPSPPSHTLPTSTIQSGRTDLEQTIIYQRSTTHSTRLDAPMTVPTQITREQTPNNLNRMQTNRDESTQMPSQEIQSEGIDQGTQMPSHQPQSTGTQNNEKLTTIPEHTETTPTTSGDREVSLVHVDQHKSFSVLPTDNILPEADRTKIHTPTMSPDWINIDGNPKNKEISHPLPNQAYTFPNNTPSILVATF